MKTQSNINQYSITDPDFMIHARCVPNFAISRDAKFRIQFRTARNWKLRNCEIGFQANLNFLWNFCSKTSDIDMIDILAAFYAMRTFWQYRYLCQIWFQIWIDSFSKLHHILEEIFSWYCLSKINFKTLFLSI